MTYGQRCLIALDQLVNALLGGWPRCLVDRAVLSHPVFRTLLHPFFKKGSVRALKKVFLLTNHAESAGHFYGSALSVWRALDVGRRQVYHR